MRPMEKSRIFADVWSDLEDENEQNAQYHTSKSSKKPADMTNRPLKKPFGYAFLKIIHSAESKVYMIRLGVRNLYPAGLMARTAKCFGGSTSTILIIHARNGTADIRLKSRRFEKIQKLRENTNIYPGILKNGGAVIGDIVLQNIGHVNRNRQPGTGISRLEYRSRRSGRPGFRLMPEHAFCRLTDGYKRRPNRVWFGRLLHLTDLRNRAKQNRFKNGRGHSPYNAGFFQKRPVHPALQAGIPRRWRRYSRCGAALPEPAAPWHHPRPAHSTKKCGR